MNFKEIKKCITLPSVLGKSMTYFTPVPNTLEYMNMYESNADGTNVLKVVTDTGDAIPSNAIVIHPFEVDNNSGLWELTLESDIHINITSFEVRISGPGIYRRYTAAHQLLIDSDFKDCDFVTITVYPKDVNGTEYQALYSIMYVNQDNKAESNIKAIADAIVTGGTTFDVDLYDVPSDVEFYHVRINEGTPAIYPASTNPLVLLAPTGSAQVRVEIRPQKTDGTYYKRIGTISRATIQGTHDISNITATPVPNNEVTPGELVTIDINPIDPNIESWTVRIGTIDIALVPNTSPITFMMPMVSGGTTVIRLIANSLLYGLSNEIHVPVVADNIEYESGGKIVSAEDPISNNLFMYNVIGTNPNVTSFEVYVNGVFVETQDTLENSLFVSLPVGDLYSLVLIPKGMYPYKPIYYTRYVLDKPLVPFEGELIYNAINYNEDFTVTVNSSVSVDGYILELSGAVTASYTQSSNVFNIPKTDVLGHITITVTPISSNALFTSISGLMEVRGLDNTYQITDLPDTIYPDTDISVNIIAIANDITGFTYTIDNGTPVSFVIDSDGNTVIKATDIPNVDAFNVIITPISNAGVLHNVIYKRITISETTLVSSGLILIADQCIYTNTPRTVETDGVYSIVDRYDVVIDGNVTVYYDLPSSIPIEWSTPGMYTVSVTPYRQGTPYTTVTRFIEVIPKPVNYNNTDPSIVDSGIIPNVPTSVHRYDGISIDNDITNIHDSVTAITYYINNNQPVTVDIGDYLTPDVTGDINTYVNLLIVPISTDGTTFQYIEKRVFVINELTSDSQTDVDVTETVHRLGTFDMSLSTPDNDIDYWMVLTSNTTIPVRVDDEFTSQQVNGQVDGIVNVEITPVSKSGITYSKLIRTLRITPPALIDSGITITAPVSVYELDELSIEWSTILNEDITSVKLQLTDSITQVTEQFVYDKSVTSHFIPNVLQSPGSVISITLTPISDTGVFYTTSEANILVKQHVYEIPDITIATTPEYNVANGSEIAITFNNALLSTDIELIRVTRYNVTAGTETTEDIAYNTVNYTNTITGDNLDKFTYRFTPIGNPIDGDTSKRKIYESLSYSCVVNFNLLIPSGITITFINPDKAYCGKALVIVVDNPDNITACDVYLDDLLIEPSVTLSGTSLSVDIPNVVNSSSASLKLVPLDTSGTGINYEPVTQGVDIVSINKEITGCLLPSDGSKNIAIDTNITVGGYLTNGFIRASRITGELYGAPIDGSTPYSLIESVDLGVQTTEQSTNLQVDTVYAPNGADDLELATNYKFIYHFELDTATGFIPSDTSTLVFSTLEYINSGIIITDTQPENAYCGASLTIQLANPQGISKADLYLEDILLGVNMNVTANSTTMVIPNELNLTSGTMKIVPLDTTGNDLVYSPITQDINIIPINKEPIGIIYPQQGEEDVAVDTDIRITGYKTNGIVYARMISAQLYSAPIDNSASWSQVVNTYTSVPTFTQSTDWQSDVTLRPIQGSDLDPATRYKFVYHYDLQTATGYVSTETDFVEFTTS